MKIGLVCVLVMMLLGCESGQQQERSSGPAAVGTPKTFYGQAVRQGRELEQRLNERASQMELDEE